ncbi:Gpi ethanolamine phosphate transferase [Thalictrum thalictroides]|uniref:Gpi ethanolamine phosphate transferase n=1 Tax=Thalictrum thalictroides TaxID=46969 RepID=A0A7J6XBA0_THATH|nr:Gpi ethanolamine phosphate transferase [Thalictrum thalictroides]
MSSSSTLTCTKLTAWTLAAVFLQILGLSLFVFGFFPVKPTLSGVSGPESYQAPKCDSKQDHLERNMLPPDQLRSLYKEISKIPSSFDRLILMVVDGLPAEFVLGKDDQPPPKAMMEAMPYTQSLLSNGTAIGYHAKAAPPTVTMPRLKAMVSGAIGGFLDVAFNFNTQALLDDNLLGQFYSIGWKMVIHGDETWIKLFPSVFMRHDGVSSFFVKDTVEVDHNVSRHIEAELMDNDWDLLILHYLGLDHVGHIGGRSSVLMTPKLKEMDEVIQRIHLGISDNHHGQTLLMVVSDHGMTDSGNHGGSSYEETDSVALFIGLGSKAPDYASATCNAVFQVDLAPTLALLFGVPIPKNNVGIVIAETIDSLTEDHQLRALELNSWQLLRLLRAQLPGLLCGLPSCNEFNYSQNLGISEFKGNLEEILYCLFVKAASLHDYWRSMKGQSVRSHSSNEFNDTVAAYNKFLRTSSDWLSRTASNKPLGLLAFGVSTMFISSVMFLSIQFWLNKEVRNRQRQYLPDSDKSGYNWHLDDSFVLLVILFLVFSMGSSSMVEEEQYTLHYMTCTLFLILLRKSCQFLHGRQSPSLFNSNKGQRFNYFRTFSIVLVLIFGRILRGWHQGGVNWIHFPDISKWLEKAGPHMIKSLQMVSGLLVIILSFFALYISRLKRMFILVVQISLLVSGILVLLHIMRYQEQTFSASSDSSNVVVQTIYTLLIMTVMVVVLGSPWVMPVLSGTTYSAAEASSVTSFFVDHDTRGPFLGLRASLYLVGWTYAVCWCLLQLLLQKPTNAMPTLLLLLQVLASMFYFSTGNQHHKQWVEVAALYFLGLAGHFSLGNTNTLATIDVAGAFIGISSHSTLFSGILMFIITYASPLLCHLSLTMYISMKGTDYKLASQDAHFGHILQMMIGIPCLVPLSLNSVILTTFTVILLIMRNHLFVWSVFSPKYMYVCAATVCVYIGLSIVAATVTYTCVVFLVRKNMLSSVGNSSIQTGVTNN